MYFDIKLGPIGRSYTDRELKAIHTELKCYKDIYSGESNIYELSSITYVEDFETFKLTNTLKDAVGLIWITTKYTLYPDHSTGMSHDIKYYLITNKILVDDNVKVNLLKFKISKLTSNVPNIKKKYKEFKLNNMLENEKRILSYRKNN